MVPNCLHYRDSLVVLDVEGKHYAKTAGYRQKSGQKIYKFSPDDENGISSGWNPLYYVRHDEKCRVKDLMDITSVLYPNDDNDSETWVSISEKLFIGLALYVMETESEKSNFNIAGLKKLRLSLGFLKSEEALQAYVRDRYKTSPLSETCINFLLAYATTSGTLRDAVEISFDEPLSAFSSPIAANATSHNSVDFRDLRKERVTIYLTIEPNTMVKYQKMVNLFLNQLVNVNLEESPQDNPDLKYQCLLLLDDFASIGRIRALEKGAAFIANYHLRLLLIFESKAQLRNAALYGEEGADDLLGSMALQIIYPSNEDAAAREYLEMLDDFTQSAHSKSPPKNTIFTPAQSSSKKQTAYDLERMEMYLQEIKEIGSDKQIIHLENLKPVLVNKIRYYEDSVFSKRADLPIHEHIS